MSTWQNHCDVRYAISSGLFPRSYVECRRVGSDTGEFMRWIHLPIAGVSGQQV